eukprot:555434_1
MKKSKLAIFALLVAFFGPFALCDFTVLNYEAEIKVYVKDAFNSGKTIAEIEKIIKPLLTKLKSACKLDLINEGLSSRAETCPRFVDDAFKKAKDAYLAALTEEQREYRAKIPATIKIYVKILPGQDTNKASLVQAAMTKIGFNNDAATKFVESAFEKEKAKLDMLIQIGATKISAGRLSVKKALDALNLNGLTSNDKKLRDLWRAKLTTPVTKNILDVVKALVEKSRAGGKSDAVIMKYKAKFVTKVMSNTNLDDISKNTITNAVKDTFNSMLQKRADPTKITDAAKARIKAKQNALIKAKQNALIKAKKTAVTKELMTTGKELL